MRRFIILILGSLLMLIFSGCGPEAQSLPVDAEKKSVEKATSVKIEVVEAKDMDEYFTLPGSLEAWEDLTLAAEISGVVDWVGPDEGKPLAAGDRILTIDSVSQLANLERDRVDAGIKKKTMERLARLVEENLVSRQEYENSVTGYEAAKQDLNLSRISLQKSIVATPVTAILDARMVERGEFVNTGDPVAVVVQVDRLKVLIDAPEKDVRYLHPGEEVRVIQSRIDSGEETERAGRITHLAYKADEMTRTYRGKIEVDNSRGELRPGMIVRIEALRREIKDAIAIPLYAVVDLEGRKVAFVEEDGKAQMHVLKIDRIIGDQVVLHEGIRAGDHLIVKGQQLLTDGVAVKVEAN